MKRVLVILGCAAMLHSCSRWVLEDRLECPSFLFFEISNPERFQPYETVYTTVFSHPEGSLIAADSPTLEVIQDKVFYAEVRQTGAVKGYGILGGSRAALQKGDQWLIPVGHQADTLYRFSYVTAVEPASSQTIPVELVKEHAKVTVQFVGMESFLGSGGQFPFDLVVRGNSCGMDAVTGVPVRGAFEYRPVQTGDGRFCFCLPRQADRNLLLELYGKAHVYAQEGFVASYDLYSILLSIGGITWREKNLPDIYIEIDYQETTVSVLATPWEEELLSFNQ